MTVSEAKKIIEKHGERLPSDEQIAAEIEFLKKLISLIDYSKLIKRKGITYENKINIK